MAPSAPSKAPQGNHFGGAYGAIMAPSGAIPCIRLRPIELIASESATYARLITNE